MHPDRTHAPPLRPPGGTSTTGCCRLCGRTLAAGGPVCFCCRSIAGQLRLPLVPTVALYEYRVGDGLHRRMRGYKDGPTAEARRTYRRFLTDDLTARLDRPEAGVDRWFGRWSVVTPVPSTRRPGPAPAGELLDLVPALAARHLPLLVRGTGATGHLAAHRDGFAPAPGVDRAGLEGLDVLVFDDSVTTGARSQSAAAALRLAGARVVGVLVVARALPPVDA